MPEPVCPEGFSGAEALWCLLRLLGHGGSLAAFRETCGPELAAEAMVPHLDRLGVQARAARVTAGDLAFLQVPTLVQLRDGSWVVLQSRLRAGYRVVGARGPEAVAGPALESALSGQVLDLSPGLPPGGGLWKRLQKLMGCFRKDLAVIVAATACLQLLGLVTPALTGVVMDRALPDGASSLLVLVAAGTVLMAAFRAWVNYVRGKALLFVSQRMDISAERGFLEHLLALPFRELRTRNLGELLQAFGGFAAARSLLAEKTLGVLLDGVLALVLLAGMAWILPGPAAAVAAVALVLAGATVLVGRAEARLQAREVEVRVKEQGYLGELLAGIATLKAAGAEERGFRRWRGFFRQGLALSLRRGRLSLGAGTAMAALGRLLDAALLVWGGLQVTRGNLGLGSFLAFMQLAAGFMAAVLGLVGTWLALMVLGPQLAKASEILDLTPEPRPGPGLAEARPETLEMEDVWFRYRPDGPWVLEGHHLRVEAGGKLKLSGPSGCGKSTLLRLAAGLEIPARGKLLAGGVPPVQARHRILYLPQFVQLYGGSILDNLGVLSGGASGEALMRAAAATGLEAWVASLPMGFRTILPQGGRTLSGGQRQWVALTAAVASGRGLLLLDEPVASMDPATAARLMALLEAQACTLVWAGHGERGGAGSVVHTSR